MESVTTTVRPATAADAAVLAELAAITFPLACPPHTTPEAIASFIAENLSEVHFDRYLADPSRTLLLAEVGGESAGYAMLIGGDPTDPDAAAAVTVRPTIELSKFYLMPGHHGTGVAAILMAAALEMARESGATSVWLGVNEENERANRFYAKNGFIEVGRKHFTVGDRVENDFVRLAIL